ncbi:DNA REPAIR PROTEIN XRCC1 [Salix koriyanagi]|uniref:DNA REPAIR PROTEIN XRCC1 n=1 Tax=Salix koriyanagi TaxID=2511006 RepID=A0A9Q0Q6J5_9ROSI|nr:DNA REPAIR PROTEIN XRCC1 [Salix koriyanagi]
MSDSKRRGEGGSSERRNLPSWMSSKDNENKSHGKKAAAISAEGEESKLLEGVVFVLSGFVNPERATLRSQALEMGAEYRPDWTSDCTLLVCAYSNTPKSRQVEADCGTIVKKEWILEGSDQKASPPRKSEKQVKSRSHSKPIASTSYKAGTSSPTKDCFPLSKVKEWVIDDLNRTISWLESQEEKPEPSEIKQIAAEGILICLQDAIDFLEQNQDVRKISDQWNVVPRAVEEVIKLVDAGNASPSLPREDLCRKAKGIGRSGNRTTAVTAGAAEYDSDETIEMTEEEIDTAYNAVVSKF